MIKIKVLSHYLFDEEMKKFGLDDNNVENTNMAFISIIGTEECIKYWIMEDDKHYFKDHSNVLNLDFDDIDSCDIIYNGHHFKTITIEQAEKTVDFIESMINKGVNTIFCHCKAGLSRSRAIAEFIYRYCRENEIDVEYEDREEYVLILNHGVLKTLNHAYWKKHKLRFYEDENTQYPRDIVKHEIKHINRPTSDENRRRGRI